MQERVNYTLVGIFVLLLSLASVGAVIWLSSGFSYQSFQTYLIYFKEPVAGLSVDAPVRYQGVWVGSVRNISLDPENPQRVRLRIQVLADTPVLTSTYASLQLQGITGITYVSLLTSDSRAPRLVSKKGIPIIPTKPSLLLQMDNILRELSTTLEEVGSGLADVLSPESRVHLQKTFSNLSALTETMVAHRQELGNLIKHFSEASEHFPELIKNMSNLADTLQHSGKKLDASLVHANHLLENVHQQWLPELQVTTQQTQQLITHLNALSKKLEKNPSALVRGQHLPTPGPGE